MTLTLPIVAIIGRPNVGKSTLVNRLTGGRDAIVHDLPGVTRDRTYKPAFWQDREFQVVDTGGLVFDDESEFLPQIREQAFAALAQSYGCHGETVNKTDQFAGAWERACAHEGPSLIELQVDPELITPTQTIEDIRRAAQST